VEAGEVKTTTILNAYIRVRDMRYGCYLRRDRQNTKFRAALLSRIEAGDRDRRNVKELLDAIDAARLELECDNPGMAYQILVRIHEPCYDDDEELENEREHYQLGGSPVYTKDAVQP
jgi:hypothetical protein